MIVVDTHIWIWWTHDEARLSSDQISLIQANETGTIGISAISLWEIAKLVEYKRLDLPVSIGDWFDLALSYPAITVLPLTPEIAIESTQLPGTFHRDPADQIIVASARVNQCQLVTLDRRIQEYEYVQTV